MDAAVQFKNASYKIGKREILSQITLSINPGTVTAILGPNGAGKTTLLSLINGLHFESSGEVQVLGEGNPAGNAKLRSRIGVVLQETALYEELSTFENLQFAASLYNLDSPIKRIIEVLELLKLADRSEQIVQTLSGGLRRRVVIARALLHDPELMIIDEPTLGVDVEARHAIWMHLRLLKSQGKTIIAATNYLDEAQALCDTAAVLEGGQLLTVETPVELVNRSGSCIDIECGDESKRKINNWAAEQADILRIEELPGGLSIFIKGKLIPDQLMGKIMKVSNIEGFRVRAPDLAEVFNSLRGKI